MTRRLSYRLAIAMTIALSIFISAPASAATITLSDSTFTNNSTAQTTLPTSPATVSLSFDICSSCGNPGPALQILSSFTHLGAAADALVFADNALTYDPSTQGVITSLNVSVQHNVIISNFSTPAGAGDVSLTTVFNPLIVQDGVDYALSSPISGPNVNFHYDGVNPGGGTTGYNTLSQAGLTAGDFVSFNLATDTFGTTHPNFAGDTMVFGLLEQQTFNFGSFDVSLNDEANFDPLTFQLSTSAPAVPEPSSLLLVISALPGALVFVRRRRKSGHV